MEEGHILSHLLSLALVGDGMGASFSSCPVHMPVTQMSAFLVTSALHCSS